MPGRQNTAIIDVRAELSIRLLTDRKPSNISQVNDRGAIPGLGHEVADHLVRRKALIDHAPKTIHACGDPHIAAETVIIYNHHLVERLAPGVSYKWK